jgi:hypothetical protein
MRATEWYCPFEDCSAEHLHHITGRSTSGAYMDEALVIPLSAAQHRLEHQVWNMLGVGDGCDGPEMWLVLSRISAHLVRLGDHNQGGVVIWPAETIRQLGRTLGRIAQELGAGARNQRWR